MSTYNQYIPTTRTKYTEGGSLMQDETPSPTSCYQHTAASYPIKLEIPTPIRTSDFTSPLAQIIGPLGTMHPIYRTDVPLLPRVRFLYI